MTDLVVGGLRIRVVGDGGSDESRAAMEAALAQRWDGFVRTGEDESECEPDVRLHIAAARHFSVDYHLDRPESVLRLNATRDGQRVLLDGGARGCFDVERGVGELRDAAHLGEVDAILRLAVSLSLPARGALLLHGTAIELGETEHSDGKSGSVMVLVGASGAGKSTAAAAFGHALSDELVVLSANAETIFASGTPYWRGRPQRREVAGIAVLKRGGGAGERTALVGSEAVRAIFPHVVRYVLHAERDRMNFSSLAQACVRVPVWRLRCPEGEKFVPFLRDSLGALPSLQARGEGTR